MAETRQCEFFVLRYVANAVQDEALNFGVVLVEAGWPEHGFAGVRLAPERDWERIERAVGREDVDMLRAIAAELERDVTTGSATREGELRRGLPNPITDSSVIGKR